MENFRTWLEILYFISGPIIAVIAFFALGQIRVAKEQIEEQKKLLKITSKRDALKLTSNQIEIYLDKIIKLQNILDKKLASENIDILSKYEVEITSDSLKLIPPKETFNTDDLEKIIQELADVANAMESFSTYFISGVADEKIAFFSIGSTYCNSVKRLLPVLIPLSNEKNFLSIINLYKIWAMRIESESLQKQKQNIEKQLKSKKETTIKVVGDND